MCYFRAKKADTGKDVIIINPNSLHFDMEHFNFIIWEDEEDLYKRLRNRIEATII